MINTSKGYYEDCVFLTKIQISFTQFLIFSFLNKDNFNELIQHNGTQGPPLSPKPSIYMARTHVENIIRIGSGEVANNKLIHKFLLKAVHIILAKSSWIYSCFLTVIRSLTKWIQYHSCVILSTTSPQYILVNVFLWNISINSIPLLFLGYLSLFATLVAKSYNKTMKISSNTITWLWCKSYRARGVLWDMPPIGLFLASHL